MVFEKCIEIYEQELLENVVPFWENHCIDKECGGFFNSLDRDGSVFDTDKWMWMQWRIVCMFATLYSSPYSQDRWLEYAKSGFEWLFSHGKDSNGMYYFGLNRQGEPIVSPYNIYSEAFAVMGSAALYKATQDPTYRNETLTAMNHYIQRMDNPKGRWEKSLPARKKHLRHGLYMIFANLGNVLKDCLQINVYNEQIKEAVEIVVDHFWNPNYSVIFENINPDYTFDLDSQEGRHIIPGHGLESCWFILQYAEQNNRHELIPKICEEIKGILDFSWDPKYGGILYFMDVLGKPHLELSWDMKLWWPHNEAILATLYAYKLTKDQCFLDWFHNIDEYAFSHFRDPEHGEWFAYLNRQGSPTHMLKGGKWKTFFHLPRCLLLGIEQMKLCDDMINR